MPRTSNYFQDCVFYVYGSRKAATENDPKTGGSGFLAAASLEGLPMIYQYYAVTAAHVVRRSVTPFLRLNKRFTKEVEIMEIGVQEWTQHPNGDDVSVCRLELSSMALKTVCIETERFLTSEIMSREDVGVGDDVFMFGRFAQYSGNQFQNIPAARFGNISALPIDPMIREDGIKQESFLVECRSIPGFSGSPVFIYKREFELPTVVNKFTGVKLTDLNGIRQLASDFYWLLGVDWCHLRDSEGVNTGMAGVIPAWKILEIINSEDFVKQRKEKAQEIIRSGSRVEPPIKI